MINNPSDIIKLENWYQVDFKRRNMVNPVDDLLDINALMEDLIKLNLVNRWFFLWEENNIRVRMKSNNKTDLQNKLIELVKHKALEVDYNHPFSDYEEFKEDSFFDNEVVSVFSSIMSEITKITIDKIMGKINFDNYRVLERISHCLFNNIIGHCGKNEENFLIQRLIERLGISKDFERK